MSWSLKKYQFINENPTIEFAAESAGDDEERQILIGVLSEVLVGRMLLGRAKGLLIQFRRPI
jgi:hypothetical protein